MIAIKGMEEMPSCCRHCPCSDDLQCNLTTQYNDLIGRPDDCPLVEIVTCKDCDYCRFELVEGIPYYWCDKDNCPTSEDFYCGNAERREKNDK